MQARGNTWTLLFLLSVSLSLSLPGYGQSTAPGAGNVFAFGEGDYLELEEPLTDLSLPLMVEAWIYLPDTLTQPFPIFVTQDNEEGIAAGLFIWVFPELDFVVGGFGDGLGPMDADSLHTISSVLTLPLPRNRWINLAAEFNVDHISFFVDGIINEQIFLPQNITLGTHPAGKTYIGKGHLFGQEYTTHGLIDDVKIWDGLRIQETHIMNLCLKLKGTELTLLHYWTMDAVEPDNTVTNLAGGPSWRVRGNPSQLRSGAPLGDEVEFRTHGAGDQVITTRIEDQTLLMTFPSSLFPVFYRNNTVFEDEEDQSCSEDFYWGIFYPYIVWDTLETYTIRSTQTQAVYTRSHGGQLWSTTPIQLQENQHQPFAGRQEFRPAVEPPELLSEDTVADCDQVVLTLQDPEISVTWNNGEIGPTLMADQPGWYVATAQSQCQNQDSTYIDILPPTELNLVGSLNQDCLFPQYELRSQATGDQLQYEWSNGELGPDILTHEPGTYRVLVSGTCGEVADEISVTFPDEFSDPVPTAFSPNGDGTNDTFQLPDYLQGVGLRVFNRWGESIHHDPNYQNLWDGHGAPDGIYYFELDDQCSGKKETSTLSIIR